jgi:hypothetical protein
MSFWRKHQHVVPLTGHNISQSSTEPEKRVPMRQSKPVEVDGVFLGAAVEHELGVRFISVDGRVSDMNESIWPNFDYAKSSARQMFRANRSFTSP